MFRHTLLTLNRAIILPLIFSLLGDAESHSNSNLVPLLWPAELHMLKESALWMQNCAHDVQYNNSKGNIIDI